MIGMVIEGAAFSELGEYFEKFPETSQQAMRMALNDVARGKGMKMIRKEMTDEIAFAKSYLNGSRLGITKRATNANPEVVITARKRATSLARFTTSKGVSRDGVSVRVKKGKTTYLKKAWLVRLNKGASKDEDNYNVGLAVRVGSGESISNKKTAHQSWLVKDKVALLYAPSVNQVFSAVADRVAEPISSIVAAEYLRQMSRLL